MTFHNTIQARDPELSAYEHKAWTQEQLILALFQDDPIGRYTPFEVRRILGLTAPITSIRRAITNLTNANKLKKTDHKRYERYGKPNFCWELRRDKQEQMEIWKT